MVYSYLVATRVGDPLVGQKIGNCVIEKRLGSGGMGVVYAAHHAVLDKPVAIKILSRELSARRESLDRFLREARLAASIDHPNVARVYDAGEAGDLAYLVMQHIDGEGLDAVLARERKLDPPRAVDIMRQVASALAAAHERGVIHRDIKPANILLSRDGVAHVVDFGLACSREGAPISRDGQVLGTADYISPEQAQGDTVDARADLYALGATFYHLVTGSRPFEGDSFVTVALKHVQEPLKPPHERDASVPLAVSGLIVKLMAKSRVDRLGSVQDVIRELDTFAGPPQPPAVPTSERPTRTIITTQVGPSPDTTSREARDLAIARLAVETRLITAAQLDECIAEQERERETGATLTLGGILMSRQYLTESQLVKLRLQHGRQETGTIRAAPPEPRPATAPVDFAPGDAVAGLKLVRRIATASRYTTWEATSPTLGRPVALRLYSTEESRLARALCEGAAAVRALAPHPNLMPVHDAGTHEGPSGRTVHYLSMDLVPTKPLSAAVEAGIHPVRAARMGAQIASALQHLHEAGRLHPPLHPAGVVVRPDGTALLMPFDAGDETPDIASPFLAPEELPGETAPVDEITDVYKVGVLIYYVITSRPPYSGLTPDEMNRGILKGRPEAPHRMASGLDPGFEAIVLRAMARDRDARPPSALVLTRELEVFLGHRKGETKPRSAPPAQGAEPPPPPPTAVAVAPAPAPEPVRPSPTVRREARPAASGLRAGFLTAALTVLALGAGAAAILYFMPLLGPPDPVSDDPRRAVRLYQEKKWAAALEATQRVLQRGPDERMEGIARDCRARLAEQSVRDGIGRVRAAWREEADPTPRVADLERAVRAMAELSPSPPPGLQGEALYCVGDTDEAVAPLERALDEGDAAAGALLGRVWLERWMLAAAFASVVPESELQERAVTWNRTAARILARPEARGETTDAAFALLNGDAGRARRFCDEALAASESADLLALRAAAAASDDERLTFLGRALGKRPHDWTALCLRGITYARQGEARAGVVDVNAAMRLAPRSGLVALVRGVVLREAMDEDGAVLEWMRAAGLRSDLADAHALCALVRAEQGRLKEAEEFGTAAIHAAPRWAGAFAQRARLRAAAGSLAEAVVDYSTALQMRPRDVRLLIERGETRLATRNTEAAEKDFEAALAIDASMPAALAGRGLARHLAGHHVKAASDYARALENAPPDWDRRARVASLLEAAKEKRPPPP